MDHVAHRDADEPLVRRVSRKRVQRRRDEGGLCGAQDSAGSHSRVDSRAESRGEITGGRRCLSRKHGFRALDAARREWRACVCRGLGVLARRRKVTPRRICRGAVRRGGRRAHILGSVSPFSSCPARLDPRRQQMRGARPGKPVRQTAAASRRTPHARCRCEAGSGWRDIAKHLRRASAAADCAPASGGLMVRRCQAFPPGTIYRAPTKPATIGASPPSTFASHDISDPCGNYTFLAFYGRNFFGGAGFNLLDMAAEILCPLTTGFVSYFYNQPASRTAALGTAGGHKMEE